MLDETLERVEEDNESDIEPEVTEFEELDLLDLFLDDDSEETEVNKENETDMDYSGNAINIAWTDEFTPINVRLFDGLRGRRNDLHEESQPLDFFIYFCHQDSFRH